MKSKQHTTKRIAPQWSTILSPIILVLLIACGPPTSPNPPSEPRPPALSPPDATSTSIASTPDSLVPIPRQVNGKELLLLLDGNFQWSSTFTEHRHPLEVREVHPGVVYFDTYHADQRPTHDTAETITTEQRVKDRIEFYQHQQLVRTFDLDQNNPYLSSPQTITVKQHYGDAEGTAYLPPSQRGKAGPVHEYHLRQHLETQDRFSKVVYWKREVTREGYVVATATTLIILDEKGRIVFQREHPGFSSVPVISPDGAYVLFASLPVETVSNAGIKTQPEGFEIWDTQKQQLLHRDVNDDPDRWIGGVTVTKTCLRVEYTMPNDEHHDSFQVLFDPVELKLYTKKFSSEEWKTVGRLWKEIDGDFLKLRAHFDFEQKNIK
ncbi:MAG: hypothetical protein AAFW73_18285 [Bacteroidota bacterium]